MLSTKPSSIISFLSKLISNGLEISILFIENAFAYKKPVKKKNIYKARNIKKYIYNLFFQ